MLKWPLHFLSRLGAVTLVGYIGWLGWDNLGPRKPEVGVERRELADRAVADIVADLRTARGELRDAALLHFGNDSTDCFNGRLRTAVEQSGVLSLRDRSVLEKGRDLLSLRHAPFTTAEAAVAEGRRLGTEAVLYGTLHTFEAYPGEATLDVEVHLADVAEGRPVFTKRYRLESAGSDSPAAPIQRATRTFPWFQRFAGWLLAVLLLPVFTIGFIRAMVRKDSNRTNAFVLAVYTLADALLAWLLVGAAMGSWLAVFVFIVAVAAAFAYNIRIMAFAVRLEEA